MKDSDSVRFPAGVAYYPAAHAIHLSHLDEWRPAPAGHRLLRSGEYVRRGDVFFAFTLLEWVVCNPTAPDVKATHYYSPVFRAVGVAQNQVVIE